MTLVVTHPYVSSITESTASGGAGGLVGPTEWNQNHTLAGLVSPAQGGTGITSGTGVTYFSSATVIADSGTLTANALVVGGGANGAPATLSSLGTTSTILHGNASGNPSFGAVNLGSEVAGTLSTGNLTAATTTAFGIVKPDNTTITISSGVISSVGGGSVSGSGSANQVTFWSSSSVIAGDGSFTYAGAGGGVTIKLSSSTSTAAALSIVTSSSSNIVGNADALNITATWNSSTTTFDAPLFMNVVNTLSAANSALIDIQQGGASNLMLFNRTASTVSPTLTLGSTVASTPVQLVCYNSVDVLNNPTNYERGTFDFTTTTNVLTIGTQKGGTGSSRNVQFSLGGTNIFDLGITSANNVGINANLVGGNNFTNITANNNFAIANTGGDIGFNSNSGKNGWGFRSGTTNLQGSSDTLFGFTNTAANSSFNGIDGTFDTSLSRSAAKVFQLGDGGANANGWMQWAGESRVSANSTTTSTALANVPGLAFKPQASRNYSFEAHLIFTDAAAGGIQCTVNATSTTTTYTLTFDGWVTDTVAVRGYAQGSAFGNVVASSLTTSTVAHVTITGTLMTSATAPSTVTIQFSQNTSNATPTTILIGSYMWTYDMP